MLAQNVHHLRLRLLNCLWWARDSQRFLISRLVALLDDHDLGAGLLLEHLDRLAALADDQPHLVPGHHHLHLPSTHRSTTATAEATSATATSTRVTTLPTRDDPIDHGLSLGNGWRGPCQSAHPLRQAARLLSHLDLAATVSLQPGDLLSAAPDDHAHHLVGHHHLLAGHPPSSHAPVHVGERCTGEGALRVTGPSAATSGEVVVVVKGTLQASSSSVVARWLDFRSNLGET